MISGLVWRTGAITGLRTNMANLPGFFSQCEKLIYIAKCNSVFINWKLLRACHLSKTEVLILGRATLIYRGNAISRNTLRHSLRSISSSPPDQLIKTFLIHATYCFYSPYAHTFFTRLFLSWEVTDYSTKHAFVPLSRLYLKIPKLCFICIGSSAW
jgi:hypothetical protein